ncbi:MAG TPA: hypothetical protein DCP63_00525, partial [Bacteroidetes bacterium]|nr:hypothetical protein [Bacteroidota bacterium]
YVRTHKFNPHNPEQILVGTSGGGLWMSSLALSSAEATEPRAMEYELQQNFPNPFNPSTTIRYRISRKSTVRLEIVDILGRKLDILVEGEQQAGAHERRWERDVPAGVYFARLTAFGGGNAGEGFRQVRRMLLIK